MPPHGFQEWPQTRMLHLRLTHTVAVGSQATKAFVAKSNRQAQSQGESESNSYHTSYPRKVTLKLALLLETGELGKYFINSGQKNGSEIGLQVA